MDECLNFMAKPKCYKNPILLLLLLCTKWDSPPKVKRLLQSIRCASPSNIHMVSFTETFGGGVTIFKRVVRMTT